MPGPAAPDSERSKALRLNRALAFSAGAGLVLAYSLRGSGSYGLVIRQENGLVIWWVVALAVAFGLLPRRAPGRATSIALGALLLYTAWVALSLLWTTSAERTVAEVARALDYAGLAVLIWAVLDRETWRAAAAGAFAAAAAICALAFASRIAPGAFPAGDAAAVFGSSRLSYPFGYWNAVGAWGAMTSAMALAWSANERRLGARALSLALIPVSATVTYLTYSRAAVIGTAVAVLAVLALSRHRWTALLHAAVAAAGAAGCVLVVRAEPQIAHGGGDAGGAAVLLVVLLAAAFCAGGAALTSRARTDEWRLGRRAARGLAAVLAAAVLIAAAVAGPGLASRAWNEFRHPQIVQSGDPATRLTSLSGARYQLWRVALHEFEAHPFDGTGAGTFEFSWNRRATLPVFVRNAHSLWIESLSELGILGLLALVAAALAALGAGLLAHLRCRRSTSVAASTAMLAAFVVFLWEASVDWMWQSTAVAVLALACIASLAARLSSGPSRLRWRGRSALALAAALAAVVQVPGLLAGAEIGSSQAADRGGNEDAALAWASDAVGAEPWGATPYLQRGLVLEGAGRLALAAADLRRAIAREPDNFRLWLVLARIETEQGSLRQALRDYGRGRALRRYGAVFQLSTPAAPAPARASGRSSYPSVAPAGRSPGRTATTAAPAAHR